MSGTVSTVSARRLETLEAVQRRVLWLSTLIIHHANKVRPNTGGLKVGGHQASSASVVSILTSLFFDFMRRGDRVAVKPHASPVLHAVHYLLGNLDRKYLTTLREFHGLQAYPSRTKDPYPVDFSTGSVGLGVVAPNFGALVDRYVQARFGGGASEDDVRFLAVVGDAELDEGSVWEAVAEPTLAHLGNVIWVVDLNRQSLDRVVPGIRVAQLEDMFRANGWTVIEAKYGRLMRGMSTEFRRWIDDLPNERYQFLLRTDPATLRREMGETFVSGRSDADLARLIADLGGHDLAVLHEALAAADVSAGPAVIFAYTIKGWGLPIAGDPLNHSALLSGDEVEALRRDLGISADDPWARCAAGSEAAALCEERAASLRPAGRPARPVPAIPSDLGREYGAVTSTQQAFGQILTTLRRAAPDVGERVVTVSPDVAISTNLGGWINQVGVWNPTDDPDLFSVLGPRLVQWDRRPRGQHMELGISETNLFMALGQLGLSAQTTGEPLFPIGTVYDPFIARALDAFIYGVYSGARFVIVGTPSGVTLAPEGGAHQSVITPAIGLALPGVVYYEPCFALELEWILLEALRGLHDREAPCGAYLRLSTAPVDQRLFPAADRETLRPQVLSGAYRLIDRTAEIGCDPKRNMVEIWAAGVMVPEAIRASEELRQDGIYASVVNCVSPDLVFRRWQAGVHGGLATLRSQPISGPRMPVVTVIDGHPSALAWVGAMTGCQTYPLGVTRFGESGLPAELYQACRIDWESIYSACCLAVDPSPE